MSAVQQASLFDLMDQAPQEKAPASAKQKQPTATPPPKQSGSAPDAPDPQPQIEQPVQPPIAEPPAQKASPELQPEPQPETKPDAAPLKAERPVPEPTAETTATAEQKPAMLGIEKSAKGFRWVDRLSNRQMSMAMAISQRAGLPEVLGRVLAGRGVTADDAEQFLEPSIRSLMPDPSELRGMDDGAKRIADAIASGEQVAVFGDYDVDGGTSSALMRRFFRAHRRDVRIYIPDRMLEGYGPNPAAIEQLCADGATLIITVDCGTTSHAALAPAKGKADVVIIDHHQADETLPDVTAVINPNRLDDISGQGHLCAAGVVFMTLAAVTRDLRKRGHYDQEGQTAPSLIELLDLVALATICDVVPLKGINRAFVNKGLQVMHHRQNAGLRALADVAALKSAPTPYHLGFVLGPRINAGGRIGNAALGAELLSTDDPVEAERIAAQLDQLNRERKAMETGMLDAAVAEADRLLHEDPDMPVIFAGSEAWHKGLVGLVASRLTERFRRPSCVISWVEGKDGLEGTGSLRSIAGIDIGAIVRAAVEKGLLIKGGGHAMAAGLTVAHENWGALQTFMVEQLRSNVSVARADPVLEIDGAITAATADAKFVSLIEQAGPFGTEHPQPKFMLPAHRVRYAKIMGEAHIRCVLEAGDGSRIDAIAFRAVGERVGDILLEAGGLPIHVVGQVRRDTWGGREKIELTIEDVAKAV